MKALAIVAVILATGCSQILGLDNTKLDQKDAPTDSPGVCDGAPACTSTAGRRSTCGQMIETGANAGQPMRIANPTGHLCSMTGSTEGPCALGVFGQSKADYFAGKTSTRTTGAIDDCGRFVVPDLDQTQPDIAIVFTGATIVDSATLVLGRPTMAGTDQGVVAPIVGMDTVARWSMQLTGSPGVTGSYLVSYVTASGAAIPAEQLRINGGNPGMAPAQPWGAYFTGAAAFGDLDPALRETGMSGSALVVPSGTFMLGGFRTGKTCTPPLTLQVMNNAVIHVRMSC